MKKFVALLLACMMLLGVAAVAECKYDLTQYVVEYDGFPLVEEPTTITMMGVKHPIHGEWADMVFFGMMENATGVHFDINTVNLESYSEQINMAINTESYAEVMLGCMITNKQCVDWGSQGILVALDEYISEELTPHLYAFLEQYPAVKGAVTAPDGHIYALPQLNSAPIAYLSAWWANCEYLEALGVTDADLPTTVEGLLELARRIRDEDPNGNGEADEIAISVYDGFGSLAQWLGAFGLPSRTEYVDDDGKVQYGMLDTEKMTKWLEFVKTLYDENLIPKDFLTMTQSDQSALGAEKRIGIAMQAIPGNIWYVDGTSEEKDSYFAACPMLPVLGSEANGTAPMLPHTGYGIQTGTFALTDLCEANGNVETMMKWVDYLYSVEGSYLIHYGPEGIIYEEDENGNRVTIFPSDGRSTEEVRGGDLTPDCGIAMPKYVRPDTEGRSTELQQIARCAQADAKQVPYTRLVIPALFFTEEETTELATLETDLDTFIEGALAKMITGELAIADYEAEVVGPLTSNFKIDRMLEIYQAAYDRYASSI
ncbi:MAG: hypothetical protein IJO98_03930 [Clostridia bacterium]|nr:hypothetical protein [Clostridia bacterium]